MTGMRPTMPSTLANPDPAAQAGRPRPSPGPRDLRHAVADRSGWIVHILRRYRPARARNPSIHRPSRPARAPSPRWASSPATCAGPGTRRPRTSSPPSTPTLWESTGHDPVRLLGAVDARPARRAGRPTSGFLDRLGAARRDLDALPHRATAGTSASGGAGRARARSPTSRPEFGITAVLPQYSGGLGILAGDHLKAASDLGVPIIGVGLLYRHGYFQQSLSREGWQQETYPVLDPDGCRSRCSARRTASRGQVADRPRRRRRARAPGSGSPRSAGCRCCCSTPTSRRTPTTSATSPTGCTAATASTGCARRCCSASAASARCGRTPGSPAPRRPRCSTPTRATPASSASSGSASSRPPRTARRSTSTPPSRSAAPAPSSPPTRRCRRASTGSRATWSSSTSAATTPVPGVPVDRILALGAEDYEGGDPASSTWR